MDKNGFIDFLAITSPDGSRKAKCYATGIEILDEIFAKKDVFGLGGESLYTVSDIGLLMQIKEFVLAEQKKVRNGLASIFDYGKANQKSYATNRFCSSAIQGLMEYSQYEGEVVAADRIVAKEKSGKAVSKKLLAHFDLTKEGTDEVYQTKRRKGQAYFSRMVKQIYANKCCISGLDIPCVLQACHILDWKKDKENRLNPSNGICMCANYHLAFDKHLITLDEDYRLVVSSVVKDFYTSQATTDFFLRFEGKQITLPSLYLPSQELLAKHRELFVG